MKGQIRFLIIYLKYATLCNLNSDFSSKYLPPSDFSVGGEVTQKMQDKFVSDYKPLVTLDNLITEDLDSRVRQYRNGANTIMTYTDVKQYEVFIKNTKANVYHDIYNKLISINTDLLSCIHEKYGTHNDVKKEAILEYLENLFKGAKKLTPSSDGKTIYYGSNSSNITENPALCRLLLIMPQHITELTRLSLTDTSIDTIRQHLEKGAKIFDLTYIESLEKEIESLEKKIEDRNKPIIATPTKRGGLNIRMFSTNKHENKDVEKAKQKAAEQEKDSLNKKDKESIKDIKTKIEYTKDYMNSFNSELNDNIDSPPEYEQPNIKKSIPRVSTI